MKIIGEELYNIQCGPKVDVQYIVNYCVPLGSVSSPLCVLN